MAIMAIYLADGLSTADYDRIRFSIGWEDDPPAGSLMHLLGHDAAGLCSLEMWEDLESFEAYVRDRFQPAFDRIGMPYPPSPRIMEVYNAVEALETEALVRRLAVPRAASVLPTPVHA